MNKLNETPSANEAPVTGAERVDILYGNEVLAEAKTMGEVRGKLGELLRAVEGDKEAAARVQQLKTGLNRISQDGRHDNVKVNDGMASNELGNHNLQSRESNLNANQLTPDQVVEDTKASLGVVLHEDSKKLGHAGQKLSALPKLGVVKEGGEYQEPVVALEGNVVENVAREQGETPDGLPPDVYGEGLNFVREVDNQKVDEYTRGSKVGEYLQELVWEQQPSITYTAMLEQGKRIGMSPQEVEKIARSQGKLPAGLELAQSA